MLQPASLCEYLERSAATFGGRVAVVDPSGRSLTYSELNEQSDRIAAFLIARGVVPGDRVGVIAPKSVEVLATLFGIMKAGAAYVPADYAAPPTRTRTLLSDCTVKAIFLDRGCAAVADNWPSPSPPDVIWISGSSAAVGRISGTVWTDVLGHPPPAQPTPRSPDALAYILYTSGSTGVPKGVMLTHANATSFVDWCSEEFRPTEDDRFGSHAPFHFDLSVLDIYVALKHGAALFLVSEEIGKNPRELAAFISTNRLTVWYSTPSILSLLAQLGTLEQRDCTSLRLVLFAGEVFPVKHLRSIVEKWPRPAFYNLYGPTETNVCTFYKIPRTIPPERTEPYPIGHLCPYCEALLLDGPGGAAVARGEEGLLHIAGASLFQGYWNRSTPGIFFERDGRRWYNTGDVVRETPEEGYLYLGRRDRMVKRRGYRIELAEIERALYQHDRLREVAAIAVPDSSAGVRIIAYITPHPGERPTIVDLKAFCARALPSYMSPDVFIFVEVLPRTSTNKVDYQSLIQMHATGHTAARS